MRCGSGIAVHSIEAQRGSGDTWLSRCGPTLEHSRVDLPATGDLCRGGAGVVRWRLVQGDYRACGAAGTDGLLVVEVGHLGLCQRLVVDLHVVDGAGKEIGWRAS